MQEWDVEAAIHDDSGVDSSMTVTRWIRSGAMLQAMSFPVQ